MKNCNFSSSPVLNAANDDDDDDTLHLLRSPIRTLLPHTFLAFAHFPFLFCLISKFFLLFFLSRQLKHYFISNLWVINCPFIIDLSPLMLISLLMHRTLQPIGFKFLISLSHSRYISAHPSPLKFHATFGT